MIDHVSVAVTELARADAFYTAVLAPIGLTKLRSEERRIGFGKDYAEFWINLRPDAPGMQGDGAHVAFRTRTSEAVDAFHRVALEHGATDGGAPGQRPRGIGPNIYYAAFVRDPDGNRLEAVTFLSPPAR